MTIEHYRADRASANLGDDCVVIFSGGPSAPGYFSRQVHRTSFDIELRTLLVFGRRRPRAPIRFRTRRRAERFVARLPAGAWTGVAIVSLREFGHFFAAARRAAEMVHGWERERQLLGRPARRARGERGTA
jgi:hypothetical protein